jgi:hypothetical protein
VLDCLYGQSRRIASAEAFINDILYQKHLFITPGTILGVMVKVIFGLQCVKEEKYKRRLIFCLSPFRRKEGILIVTEAKIDFRKNDKKIK